MKGNPSLIARYWLRPPATRMSAPLSDIRERIFAGDMFSCSGASGPRIASIFCSSSYVDFFVPTAARVSPRSCSAEMNDQLLTPPV